MKNNFSFEAKGNSPDHYTEPRNHIIRIETALSNTAARLWDALEKSLDSSGGPRDAIGQTILRTVRQVQDVEHEAFASWQQGRFQQMTSGERLRIGAHWASVAKTAVTEAAKAIGSLSAHSNVLGTKALDVLAAQERRLEGLLQEQQERPKCLAAHSDRADYAPKPECPTLLPVQAQTQSGLYSGTILEAGDLAVLQRISPAMNVIHKRQLLSRTVEAGESVSIRYSGGTGLVTKALERAIGMSALER